MMPSQTLVGSEWRNVEMGGTYFVVMDMPMTSGGLTDGAYAYVVMRMWRSRKWWSAALVPMEHLKAAHRPDCGLARPCVMTLPVTIQMSTPIPESNTEPNWVVYKSLSGPFDGRFWARPAGEFVDGRFKKVKHEQAS